MSTEPGVAPGGYSVFVNAMNESARADDEGGQRQPSMPMPRSQQNDEEGTGGAQRKQRSGNENILDMNFTVSAEASIEDDAQQKGSIERRPLAAKQRKEAPPPPQSNDRVAPAGFDAKATANGIEGWGGDTAKALKSLSSCQSSRPDSARLGHEQLFSTSTFTAEDWKAHTSFRRYLPEPRYLYRVIRALMLPLTLVIVVTTGCAIYEEVIKKDSWEGLKDIEVAFAYSLCSFALSLLLIFKTNSSYSRFWEARSAWGNLYTDCRAFILKMQAHAPECEVPLRKALLRWTIVLPYVMRSHLLHYAPGTDSLEEVLTKEEVGWLRRPLDGLRAHQPMRAAGVMMSLTKKLQLPAPAQVDAQNLMKSVLDRCATCEKLLATPIPLPYTRHTARFILLYCGLMPIVLWKNLEFGTFFVAPLITFALAGIDTVGIYIENPITILPLVAYCQEIHQDVLLAGHAWAAGGGKDTPSQVDRFLQATPPEWQQAAQVKLQRAYGGHIDGLEMEENNAPAIYRRHLHFGDNM